MLLEACGFYSCLIACCLCDITICLKVVCLPGVRAVDLPLVVCVFGVLFVLIVCVSILPGVGGF